MQRNGATHKSTDTLEHSLCLPAEARLRRNFSRSIKLNFPRHGRDGRLGKGRQVPNAVSGISCARYAEPQSEGLSRLREPPRERVGPSCYPTADFIFPSNEIAFVNSKARPIRPPIHAPAGPPGAPQSSHRPCRENGAHHPISLPGNQKDEPPSLATKWRLPLGPQNRHNSLVSSPG